MREILQGRDEEQGFSGPNKEQVQGREGSSRACPGEGQGPQH
jgi:hypothetical protein